MNVLKSGLLNALKLSEKVSPQPISLFDKNKLESLNISPLSKTDELKLSVSKKTIKSTNIFNSEFVKSENGKFTLDGKPFRYVGTNMYSLGWESIDVAEKMISDASKEGFTVIRFWAYDPMSKEKLGKILDLGQKYNMKFIPVLYNNWKISEEERTNDNWYKEGYKEKYLPFVKDVVNSYKDRPEVMIWELINEPETDSFNSAYNFSKNVSEEIDNIDKNHLISIGTIGGVVDRFGSQLSRLSTENFKKLYKIPTLDAVSIHDYSYDATILERLDIESRNQGNKKMSNIFGKLNNITSFIPKKVDNFFLDLFNTRVYNPLSLRGVWMGNNLKDIQIAKELNKPLYVGEVGIKKFHGEERKNLFALDMESYFDKGAQGYMMWSFQAQGRSVDGHDYGFTSEDDFSPIIREWNNKFLKEIQ